jgi:hypothetical protein
VAEQPTWHVACEPTEIIVTAAHNRGHDDELSLVRAVAAEVWSQADTPQRRPLVAGDDAARQVLDRAVAAGIIESDSVNTS